ncbi:hypothetical protein AA105894_1033 [Asaia spathodeae NBRC 105894]|uniref:Uncharacterized protein n=2 Tax=Asaia spathodeae TaxID=657016 RepID=A0ABX2P0U5_9PROT|nr:hypothetical protein AA105894_1033 [Asaia spathodeae NBRC 105894]
MGLMTRIVTIAAAALGILGTLTPSAFAQSAQQTAPQAQQQTLSPVMKQDIEAGLRYPLPADFMPRAAETLQALQAANIRPPNSTQLSLQQTIGQIAATPGVPAILSAHGFTPESFTMGMTAFGMTLAATNGQALPAGLPAPNAGNVALFHAHPEQVTALMQAMGTPPGQN